MALLALICGVHAFSFNMPLERGVVASRHAPTAMMAKGFGKPGTKNMAPPPAPKKPPSEGSKRRNKAAADFDALKSSGAPEYEISVRTVFRHKSARFLPRQKLQTGDAKQFEGELSRL